MCCHAHMATQKRKAKQPPPSRGRPTNLYLPADLRERLEAVSTQTGIPMSRITADGLRWRLDQLERAFRNGGS